MEERIAEVYLTDAIQSPIHLSIGQEFASVGVCAALRPQDVVFGTYRGHALYLAKGGSLERMLAELYGKVTGCAGGKAGSMHLVDADAGVLATSAVVGTTIPLAVGHAYADRMRSVDRVSACFFGDGATEEGVFYESVNFAVLHGLPVLFVCENNGLAVNTPVRERQARTPTERAKGMGIRHCAFVDLPHGGVVEVYEAARDFMDDILLGDGPAFLEVEVERRCEHVGLRMGVSGPEVRQRDSLDRIRGSSLSLETVALIEAAVEAEIDEAFVFAKESPLPVAKDMYEVGEVPWRAY